MSGNTYHRLLRVTLGHSYYGDGDPMPGLAFQPTPGCRELMGNLGLIFRPESSGFSVFYRSDRRDSLYKLLRRQAERFGPRDYDPHWPGSNDWNSGSPAQRESLLTHLAGKGLPHLEDLARHPERRGEPQFWTRLSFVMTIDDPLFVNVTALPAWADPGRRGFFFTNLHGSADRHRYVLTPQPRVDADALVSMRSGQFSWRLPGGDGLIVRDLAGRVVRDLPRLVPEEMAADVNPVDITGAMVRAHQAQAEAERRPLVWKTRRSVQVDLSDHPEGLYLCEATEAERRPRRVLTCGQRPPLGFFDLLLTDPTGCGRGRFPVTGLDAKPVIDSVDYDLRFAARRTLWTYFIVPQPHRDQAQPLRIESRNDHPVRFSEPRRVTLPDGVPAYAFVSEEALPLRRQSEFRFRLYGRRRGPSADESILMDCLPVASNLQVRPAASVAVPSAGGHSDIYVHL